MSVPSRVEHDSPSDPRRPLLPTTFPLYERYFREEPPLFYVSDVMPPKKVDYIEHFWREEFPGIYPALLNAGLIEKGKRNIARHNIMAGMYAHDLAYLSGLPPQRVATAAGIHDAGKTRENEYLRVTLASDANPQTIMQALEASKLADRNSMETLGYPAEVIALMGANVPKKPDMKTRRGKTQRPSLESMASKIAEEMSPEEQIVWYVDAMLLDTVPVDLSTRFSVTASNESSRTEREARNQAVKEALSEYYGFDYHELQLKIGERVEILIAQRIKEHHPELYYLNEGHNIIPFFLQIRLDQRVEDWENESIPTPLLQVVSS